MKRVIELVLCMVSMKKAVRSIEWKYTERFAGCISQAGHVYRARSGLTNQNCPNRRICQSGGSFAPEGNAPGFAGGYSRVVY